MTAEKLHDALNLLPSDLLTATDQLRMAPRTKIIPWKRLIPMAACLALLICSGAFLLWRQNLPGHMMMKQESAAEAPAAMAPLPESHKVTADAAVPQAPAMDEPMMEAPAEEAAPQLPVDIGTEEVPYEEAAGSESGRAEEFGTNHSHNFAEELDSTVNSHAYCGNTEVTVTVDGTAHRIAGSDAVKLTDILVWLDYDPGAVCRCMAEFTVDTETLEGIQVNLTEAYARCEAGQAALTEAQVQTIRTIIDKLS